MRAQTQQEARHQEIGAVQRTAGEDVVRADVELFDARPGDAEVLQAQSVLHFVKKQRFFLISFQGGDLDLRSRDGDRQSREAGTAADIEQPARAVQKPRRKE